MLSDRRQFLCALTAAAAAPSTALAQAMSRITAYVFSFPGIDGHDIRLADYRTAGGRFDAESALRIGLVHEVAPDLDAAIERVAGELLSAGPEATRAAKQQIRERPGGEEAARLAAKLRTSPEGQEGLRAFLDKRPAAWRSGSSS